MIDKANNKSRGFGFVTMKEPNKLEEILKNQLHIVDGKAVECKIAVPKESMNVQPQVVTNDKCDIPGPMEDTNGAYNSRKIFVGGLPPLLKEGSVKLK
jgi:RNA recognition motif-containing protein